MNFAKAKKKWPYLELVGPTLAPILDQMEDYISRLLTTNELKDLPFDASVIETLFLPNLPAKIAWQANRTLALEVNLAGRKGKLVGKNDQAQFAYFMRQLGLPTNNKTFYQEYSVLEQLLTINVEQWAANTLELVTRLAHDWQDICTTLAFGHTPGELVEIIADAGDSHRAGHSVHLLKFSSGFKLVYKPRSLSLDVHFQELLGWFNELGKFLPFQLLKVLDKTTYGWVEYIEQSECQSQTEVGRFYNRQGGLLALLYSLRATDFHYENVIAKGEQPFLIDLEGLFQPKLWLNKRLEASLNRTQISTEAGQSDSVLEVGLIVEKSRGETALTDEDISGLSGGKNQLFPRKVPVVEAVGTAQMRVERKLVRIKASNNKPFLKGVEVEPGDYYEQFVEGFRQFYQLLLDCREALIAGPLQNFRQDENRLIIRSTSAYLRFLQESYHPDFMRDAQAHNRFFDRLGQIAQRDPDFKPLVSNEQKDLERGDVPLFTSRVNKLEIYSSTGQPVPGLVAQSGWDTCLERLQKLSPSDLQQQLEFIDTTFSS